MIYNPWNDYKFKFSFDGCEIIDNSYSQAWQDTFVLTLLKGKREGTYLELGANVPQFTNNTFLLASKFNWRGISIDCYNFEKEWKDIRPDNLFLCADAVTLDYTTLLDNFYSSTVIDYLQLDIDTVDNILKILENLPEKYKFRIITLETDLYAASNTATIEKTREFLSNAGYKLLIKDVKVWWENDWQSYEDWWVHPDYVDLTLAEMLKNSSETCKAIPSHFLFEQPNTPKILFVTQELEAACGIGQIGHSYAQALQHHPDYNFEIFYSNNLDQIKQKIRDVTPSAVIYNYSPVSTPWINDPSLRQGEFENILHIRFMHDINQWQVDSYTPEQNFNWTFNLSSDPSLIGNQYVFPVNRILPDSPKTIYSEPSKPIIGFHGFGFPHKGIHRIAEQVVQEFDKATIKLHMPYAFYGDQNGYYANIIINQVKEIIKDKPGIELITSHEMLEPSDIIEWLAQNTINCYFFDYQEGIAPSSSLDFALAARRPVAVTRSYQMRQVWNLTPSILIEENSLKNIIENGIQPVEHLYTMYSKESVCADFSRALHKRI